MESGSPVSPGFQELICGLGTGDTCFIPLSLQIEPKSFPTQAKVLEVFLPSAGVLPDAGPKDLGIFPHRSLFHDKSDFRVLRYCEE